MKLGQAIDELRQATSSAFQNINTSVDGLIEAARTSDLTELRNALALEEDFAGKQRSKGEWLFLFGDLNGFKSINDTYGHEAGDAALRYTGKILAMVAHSWHATAYHKSGDEFAVLVPYKHKEGFLTTLKQYLGLVSFPFENLQGHHRLELSGSFGCVEVEGLSLQETQERAESACQIAKRRGRNYVVHEWSPGDQLEAIERRMRCKCGTEFRCTLTGEHLNRQTLHCPVCQAETSSSGN